MKDLYNYIFWYNSYQSLWYAIPSDKYLEFFNGNRTKVNGVITSMDINELTRSIKQST